MKRKKGFTLIELLAVIVILAIIALIATPIILNMINDARKSAAADSAYGYIEAMEYKISLNMLNPEKYEKITDGKDIDISTLNVEVKGTKPSNGKVTIEKGIITNANLCINGFEIIYDGKEITEVTKNGNCENQNNDNIPTDDENNSEKEDDNKTSDGFVTNGLIKNFSFNKDTELISAIGEPTYNDDYINLEGKAVLATQENLKLESPFTLALRFRNLKFSSSQSTDYSLLIGNGTTGSNIGSRTVGILFHKNLGTITVHAGAGDNKTISLDSSLLFNNNEAWKTLVLRYDSKSISLWLDGKKLGELEVALSPKDTQFFIGGYGTSGTSSSGVYWGFMNGDYSNCAIYNRGLTDEEIINFEF